MDLRSLVRPVVTLALTATFCYLSVAGIVKADTFTTVVTTVISFWFATRSNKPQA